MMDLTESLICGAIEATRWRFVRPWGEATVDFTPPWPRRTYAELLAEHAGVDPTISRRSRLAPSRSEWRPRAKTRTLSPTNCLKRSSRTS